MRLCDITGEGRGSVLTCCLHELTIALFLTHQEPTQMRYTISRSYKDINATQQITADAGQAKRGKELGRIVLTS